MVYTDSNGDRSIIDYAYDMNENVIQMTYTYSDQDKVFLDFTYDTKGNMTKLVLTYPDNDPVSVSFEYKLVYIPFELPEYFKELLEEFYDY